MLSSSNLFTAAAIQNPPVQALGMGSLVLARESANVLSVNIPSIFSPQEHLSSSNLLSAYIPEPIFGGLARQTTDADTVNIRPPRLSRL